MQKLFDCEASLAGLGPAQQNMFERLKSLYEKYEIANLTMPDIMRANMGASVAAMHAEIQWLAKLILEKERPREASEIDLTLTRLEMDVEMAMRPPSMRRDSAIPGKRAQETRGFEDDWSDLAPPPGRQQQRQETQQWRPLNEPPPSPGSYDFGSGFNPGWPPSMKP